MTWVEKVIDGKNNWLFTVDHAGGYVEQEDDYFAGVRTFHWCVWCFLSNNEIGGGIETTLEEAQRQVRLVLDDSPVERVHNWKYGL